MPEILIVLGLGGLGYTFVVYPALVRFLASAAPLPPVSAGPVAVRRVSVVLACAGEFSRVVSRVSNALSQGAAEVVLALDGVSLPEELRAEVERFGPALEVVELPGPRGKTGAQNAAVEAATGDLLVFSDMASLFEPGAIEALCAPLADPAVGATCGRLRYEQGGLESAYWDLECELKRCESAFSGLLGANGAIYALRRSDYVALPDTAMSDLTLPLVVHLLRDARTVFVPEAVATEPGIPGGPVLRDVKRRITVRALGSLPILLPCLDVFRRPRLCLAFVSHKLLRWASWMFVGSLVGGLIGLHPAGALAVFAGVTCALAGAAGVGGRVGRLAEYLVTLWAAQALAFADVLRGHRVASWAPTHLDRAPAAPDVSAPATEEDRRA